MKKKKGVAKKKETLLKLGENMNWYSHMKNSMEVTHKIKTAM